MTSCPRAPRAAAAAAAVVAVLLAGCSDPQLVPPGQGASEQDEADGLPSPGPAASLPDPHDAELLRAGRDLLATLADARTAFDQLARADEVGDAEPVAARLVATLAADPRWADVDDDGEPDDVGVRPLLPGPVTSREETVDYGDAFTAVLSASRAAGPSGAAFLDALRDPVTSDLGAWQRDPGGVLDAIEDAVRRVRSVDDAEDAVASLAGEGPRALAWALLADRAAGAGDLELVRACGERGVVHVELMLDAIRPLVERGAAPEGGAEADEEA